MPSLVGADILTPRQAFDMDTFFVTKDSLSMNKIYVTDYYYQKFISQNRQILLLSQRPHGYDSELGGGYEGAGVLTPGQARDLPTSKVGYADAVCLTEIIVSSI